MDYPEICVANLDDVSDPGAVEFRGSDPDWPFRGFVVRWQGGVYAYANVCAHQGHALNLEADKFFDSTKSLLICASHGALFEPETGLCVGGPCPGHSLLRLECRVADEGIYVKAPDSQREMPGFDT